MVRIACVFILVFASLAVAAAERSAEDDARSIDDPRVQHLSYRFLETGETIPYALFVPRSYDRTKPAPLMVALHGLGRTYDWLMGYDGLLDAAEAGGYIVLTPLGYTRRGWYGSRSTDADGRTLGDEAEHSEQDVMQVLGIVRTDYNIDPDRIYLWGHDMGGAGTFHLAARHPQLWAGLGVVAPATPEGISARSLLERIRDIPIIALHGTDDALVPVSLMREWATIMGQLGMQYLYVEVPGGDHSRLIAENRANMERIVDFFDIVCRCNRPAMAP